MIGGVYLCPVAIFPLRGYLLYSLQLFGFQTFVEDLFCQPLAIPKTAADITETSLEVEMDIYKSSILLSSLTVLFSHRFDNDLAEKQFQNNTIKIIVYQS